MVHTVHTQGQEHLQVHDAVKEHHQLTYLRPEVEVLKVKLEQFVERCIQLEDSYEEHVSSFHGEDRWSMAAIPPCLAELKAEARRLGFWNLFLQIRKYPLPRGMEHLGPSIIDLTVREYGILCEVMGGSFLAPEACNCSAPDTGNMEVLLEFGSSSQKKKWLPGLLNGDIRSAFLMTEPDVASSDATNISCRLTKVISPQKTIQYELNGRKWWSTGAMDPRCKVAIVLARLDYSHESNSKKNVDSPKFNDSDKKGHADHTMVVIPIDANGVTMVRPLTVFGYDDAPHGHAEVQLSRVSVSMDSIILGEGKGFKIAQARLGPGRIHHCMRAVGLASRCYELMVDRTMQRKTFGKILWQHGGCQEMIAESAAELEMARLMTLACAAAIDEVGAVNARDKIGMIKYAVPNLACSIVDRAVQVFGGAGVCSDFILARALAGLRTLRIADGPDAVHRRTVAIIEVKKRSKAIREKNSLLPNRRSKL